MTTMNEQIEAAGYGPPGGYGPPQNPYGPPPGGPPGYGPPPGGFGPPGGGFGPPGMVPPPPGFGSPMGDARFHGLAIASMICGIVAIVPGCCCTYFGIPLPIASIVMGIIAVSRIKAAPYQFKGNGMAIAGIVCSSVALMWDVFAIFSTIDDEFRNNYGGGGP